MIRYSADDVRFRTPNPRSRFGSRRSGGFATAHSGRFLDTVKLTDKRVLMGLLFFPRGGSAHVAQNLAQALPATGWDVRILSGSVSIPGRPGDAREFYAGLDVVPVDMPA